MTRPKRSFSLARKAQFKDPAPLLLVACEGKTEANCIESLRGVWRIPAMHVQVRGQIGVPKTIVDEAVEWVKDFKKSDRLEVWVVFDRDEHDSWPAAIDRAHARKFKLAISNPCFELWAILLYQEQNAHLHRHAAQSMLKGLHAGYDHDRSPTLNVSTLLLLLDDGHQRCEKLCGRSPSTERHANPSTTFHHLVQRLRELQR